MPTHAEQYFFTQIASQLSGPNDVVATGYFRTFIGESRGRLNVAVFANAAKAQGHFLALTSDRLLLVKTRAPATSSPLLENQGSLVIPLASIRKLTLDSDLLLIESDVESLALQLTLSNNAFPSQERLIHELAARFNTSETVASIRSAQSRKRVIKIGIVAAVIVAALLWSKFGK